MPFLSSWIAVTVFVLATFLFGLPQTMTGGSVAAEFRGEWVPVKARCTSPLRLIIEPNVVTFVKGADRAEFRKLDQCFTCMGHDVENITLPKGKRAPSLLSLGNSTLTAAFFLEPSR